MFTSGATVNSCPQNRNVSSSRFGSAARAATSNSPIRAMSDSEARDARGQVLERDAGSRCLKLELDREVRVVRPLPAGDGDLRCVHTLVRDEAFRRVL